MTAALLTGTYTIDQARMRHWHELTHVQQCAAVHRMADAGESEITIAWATGWSKEFVMHVLGGRHGG